MEFADIKQATPRLAVAYQRGPDGQDRFQWGMVGAMPLLSLIGYIGRVQADMASGRGEARDRCPGDAFVIAMTPDGGMEWWAGAGIPADPLLGMIEVIKATIIGGRAAQQVAAQRTQVLGPDGKPFTTR